MLEIFVTIIGILVAYLIPSGIIMMFPKKTRILGKAQLTGGLFIAALMIIIFAIMDYSPKDPIWQGRNVLWYNTSIIATIIGSVLVFAVITLTLFGFYKKLLNLRKNSPAMLYGDLKVLSEEKDLFFVFEREYEDEKLLVICNFEEPSQIKAPPNAELVLSNYKQRAEKFRPYEIAVYKY